MDNHVSLKSVHVFLPPFCPFTDRFGWDLLRHVSVQCHSAISVIANHCSEDQHFTLGRKWISLLTFNLYFPIWPKFGMTVLHIADAFQYLCFPYKPRESRPFFVLGRLNKIAFTSVTVRPYGAFKDFIKALFTLLYDVECSICILVVYLLTFNPCACLPSSNWILSMSVTYIAIH
jgi:hypothetical protein